MSDVKSRIGCILVCLGMLFSVGLGGCGPTPAPEPRQLTDARYQEMLVAFGAHDYPRVKKELASLRAAGIQDQRAYYLEAMIELIEKRPENAKASLLEALKINPQFAMAHNALGAIYMEEKNLAQAETEFIKAVSNPLYTTPEKGYQNLGNLYRQQHRDDLALACYQKALKFNPNYFPAHYELARLYFDQQKYLQSTKELDKAQKLSPKHPGVWLLRGRLDKAQHQPRSAYRAFHKVIELEPVGPFAEEARRQLEEKKPENMHKEKYHE